ncbi:MAG: thiol-disulfide oxidoreductase DCC family protein [Phycisphaerales bacterium]
MGDRSVPSPNQHVIVLFDGDCVLCSRSVRWIIARDRRKSFRFAALRSAAGRATMAAAGVDPGGMPESVVVVDGRGVHTRSGAVIRIARGLGFPWSLAQSAAILPRAVRDWVYDRLARNRHRLTRGGACPVAGGEVEDRFLDGGRGG